MSQKGILRTKVNGEIVEYYPQTTYDNVINETGGNLETDITDLKQFKQTTSTKLDGIASSATKTEKSSTNGNIKINGVETTVYTHPTTSGNKHIPSGGSSGQILRWSADGTAVWGADNNTTYSVATTTTNGLMSSTDKSKLDGIATGANKYVHPTGDGNSHIPANGTSNSGKYLQATGTAGTYQWASLPTASTSAAGVVQLTTSTASTSTTLAATASAVKSAYDLAASKASTSVATTSANGLMSSTDKSKLDGIASGANNYSHPTSDGNKHVPANGTTNSGKYLQATATAGTYQWASLPTASTSVAGIVSLNNTVTSTSTTVAATANAVKTAYDKANHSHPYAATSHGNHVPATQTASNAVFLRNDNTWATVTPANIGAAASSHTHNYAGSSSAGGAANSATILATARTINGTSFNGSANITTANWGTARTLTIGNTGKSVNGSANVSWGLNEIGAAPGLSTSGTTAATAQWYRIAQSGADIANNIGEFHIRASASGVHSSTILTVGVTYGQNPTIQQISHTQYSGVGISKARIVYHTTYSGNRAYLEVYVPTAVARTINVQLFGTLGWSLLTPSTVGSIPSGYTNKEITLSTGNIVSNVVGNASTATALQTARTINGTSFNGSANITTANWGTARTITIGSTGKSVNGSANVSWSLSEIGAAASSHTHNYAGSSSAGGAATSALACTGNSATATTLQTARTINGTSFNGSANITTANWGTARTLTIGSTGKSVNGSANVSWSLAEIGAAAASHTHDDRYYTETEISNNCSMKRGTIADNLTGAVFGTYLTNTSGVTNLPQNWMQGRHTLASLSVSNEASYDLQLLGGYYEQAMAFRIGSSNKWYEVATTNTVANPNILINGDFQVWQRGTSFTFNSSSNGMYTADRWRLFAEGGAAFTVSKENTYMKINFTTGGSTSHLRYEFEKEQLKRLVGLPITFTMDIETSKSLTFGIVGFYGASVSQKDFTVNGRAKCVYTIKNFSFTEQTTNPHIQFIRMGTSSWTGTIKVYSIKMEVSTTPTAFSTKPYAEELSACKYYFERIGNAQSGVLTDTFPVFPNAVKYGAIIKYARKRVSPTIKVSAASNYRVLLISPTSGVYSSKAVTSIVKDGVSEDTATLIISVASAVSTTSNFQGLLQRTDSATAAYIDLDAELY